MQYSDKTCYNNNRSLLRFAFHISEFHATEELHILDNFWQRVEITMQQYLTGFLTPTGTWSIRMKKEPNMWGLACLHQKVKLSLK